MQGTLGILGGMGPLATADFFRKVVEETAADSDQEHIPVIICSLPDIPCRSTAIMGGGTSPLPRMLEGMYKLKQSEVECAVIPCNTAHYWYSDLCKESDLPILHIVDAVDEELRRLPHRPRRLGLLATEPTLATRIYQDRLAGQGYTFIVNSPAERDMLVTRSINLVKQGLPKEAGRLLEQALRRLFDREVEAPILACTELPIALEAVNSPLLPLCIDATRALARYAVAWASRRRTGMAATPD